MTQEEINKICDRAEMQYEQLKDKCHEQYEEIQQLKNKLKNIKNYVENDLYGDYGYECIEGKKDLLEILGDINE